MRWYHDILTPYPVIDQEVWKRAQFLLRINTILLVLVPLLLSYNLVFVHGGLHIAQIPIVMLVFISVRMYDHVPVLQVKDPEGYLHHVLIGDQLGPDLASVYDITPTRVWLSEIRCLDGRWQEIETAFPVPTPRTVDQLLRPPDPRESERARERASC